MALRLRKNLLVCAGAEIYSTSVTTTPASPARSLTPRRFLKSSADAGAFLLKAPAFLRGKNLNEKLNIAVTGSGGRGASNLQSVGSENIVALCDVNDRKGWKL